MHAIHASEYNSPSNDFKIVHDTVPYQYTLKKGLQVFGKAGAAAVTKELIRTTRPRSANPETIHGIDSGTTNPIIGILDVPQTET